MSRILSTPLCGMLLAAALLLDGCGQRGPLYLPASPARPRAAATDANGASATARSAAGDGTRGTGATGSDAASADAGARDTPERATADRTTQLRCRGVDPDQPRSYLDDRPDDTAGQDCPPDAGAVRDTRDLTLPNAYNPYFIPSQPGLDPGLR